MEEREPLRLTFELPAQALDQAARLLEAVRLLLEAGQARGIPARQPLEQGESAGFDEDRFRALSGERGEDVSSAPLSPAAETSAAAAAAAPSPIEPPGETAPAASAPSDRMAEVPAVPTAGEVVSMEPGEAESVRYDLESLEDPEVVQTPEREQAEPPGPLPGDQSSPPEPPGVQTGDMVPIPDAPTARPEAGQSLEDLPAAEVTVQYEAAPPPGAVQTSVTPVAEQVPDSFRRTGRDEAYSALAPRPAPLTAEAVNLAFRRDDRRYDNGFPFY